MSAQRRAPFPPEPPPMYANSGIIARTASSHVPMAAAPLQAEERNATLEMQATARPASTVASGGGNGPDAAPEIRCHPAAGRGA